MPFFKYYRANSNFEKSIRYNELYFSENKELNDPHDLKAFYFFEDDAGLWADLLQLPSQYDSWSLESFLNCSCQSLPSALNEVFKGIQFDSLEGSLFEEIEKVKQDLLGVFESHLKEKVDSPKGFEFYADYSPVKRAELCLQFLSALLARAVSFSFYSVSFSESALNPMMWAHYADGFKGCVVIYRSYQEEYIGLGGNILEQNLQVFKYSKVSYIDSDKMIPVLACSISGSEKAQQAFLQKNSFWNYESEYRLFSMTISNPTQHAIVKERLKNPRARILHHQTNDILGVIFGPRSTKDLKERVDMTLMDNRRYCGSQPFYLLETELTRDGRVIISSAKKQCDPSAPNLPRLSGGMHEIIEGARLEAVLAELNIK